MRPSSPRRTPSYTATARSLATPLSPSESPTSHGSVLPTRQHSTSFADRRGSASPQHARPGGSQRRTSSLSQPLRVLDEDPYPGLRRTVSASHTLEAEQPWAMRMWRRAEAAGRGAWRAFLKLSRGQQVLVGLVVLGMLAATAVLVVYNERIYAWLYPHTQAFAQLPGSWLLLWVFIVATAFPPMMGYSTAVTLCGFIYGMKGWLVCSTANVLGSTLSFLVFRRYLSGLSAKLAAKDPRFAAFNLVLARDGLPLLIAIRLCPLPYSLSNAGLSTLPPVRALPFAIASAVATPKLLIHVFIGDRLAAIARGDQDGMDAGAKAANYAGIAIGVLVGAGTGIIIYKRTVARARQLEAEQAAAAEEEEGLAGGWAEDGEYDEDEDEDASGAAKGGRGTGSGLAHPDAFADDGLDDDDPWGHSEERESRDEVNFLGLDSNAKGAGKA